MTFLDGFTFWHWFILGGVLMVLELVAPAFVFLFIGAAAVITGLMVFFFPGIGWEQQVLVFAVLAVAAAVGGRMWVRSRPITTDQPALNRRGQQYVGLKTFPSAAMTAHPVSTHVNSPKNDDPKCIEPLRGADAVTDHAR